MTDSLLDYLIQRGWAKDIARDVVAAYNESISSLMIRAIVAAETCDPLDDEENDYSGNMYCDIRNWQKASVPGDD